MTVVKNLMIRGGADFSPMKKSMDKASKDIGDFKTSVAKGMQAVAAALSSAAALGLAVLVKDAVKSAMDVEAAIQQINRMMGSSAQAFLDWAQDGAKAFGFARADAIRFGAIYANLLSGFATDTATTMKYTQDLLKASAVVAAATGRQMQDVMERIRSGLLGETDAIEDLGININVAMIETTKAFRDLANGRSWENLGFNTQQTIRYFAILEQASRKYGLQLAENTNSRQLMFVAQLKDLQLALGNAFLPVYNAVLPALTSMTQALANAMDVVAQFMQTLFGKAAVQSIEATKEQSSAVNELGEAYKEAGKKAKGAVAGFDEINQLADAEGAAAGVGTGTTALGKEIAKSELNQVAQTPEWMEQLAQQVREFLEPLRDPIKRVTEAFKSLWEALKGLADTAPVKAFFNMLAENKRLEITIGLELLAGILEAVASGLKIVTGLFNLDFKTALEGAEGYVSAIFDTIKGVVEPFFPDVAAKMEQFKKGFGAAWSNLKGLIEEKAGPVIEAAKKKITEIKDEVLKRWDALKTESGVKWDEFKVYLSEKWTEVQEYTDWDSIRASIIQAWTNLQTETGRKWDAFKEYLSQKWAAVKNFTDWGAVKDAVLKKWDELRSSTGEKFDDLKSFIKEKWDAISKIDLSSVGAAVLAAWGAIKSNTATIWSEISGAVVKSINAIVDSINSIIRTANKASIKLPNGTIGVNIPEIPRIPNIPKLARGGIVDGATNMGNYIAGEAGAEMIVPLENTSFVDKLASALGTAVMNAMQVSMGGNNGGRDGPVIVMDTVEVARVLYPHIDRESRRRGGALIQTT
ncbi:hypothetical protein [Paenibacillus sp.]|uniref:hypothetical protein n=1 Tax=Paenibacillus sp. TaxID=58172 RepID=UPI002D5F9245|nr:hypothetical protein [Paenibacillus sp.]HZG83829.1 hypothetical protein [Paenibacillus sp.]